MKPGTHVGLLLVRLPRPGRNDLFEGTEVSAPPSIPETGSMTKLVALHRALSDSDEDVKAATSSMRMSSLVNFGRIETTARPLHAYRPTTRPRAPAFT